MKLQSTGYSGFGFPDGTYVRRLSDKQIQEYRKSLGPCPRFPRVETVERAIAAATLSMQCTDDTLDYEQCVRNVLQLRGIYEMLQAKAKASV